MCGVNHKAFARPGYLIDVHAESLAAEGALFTGMLAHHAEVGLSGEQIRGLLDLSREYHARQITIRLKMATLAEQVEHKRGRLTTEEIAERKAALDTRAELFRDDEMLFFEFAAMGHGLLDDEQLDRIDSIYHAEKDEGLDALAGALTSAVGPAFAFAPVP